MSKEKLTLSVDESLLRRAQSAAAAQNTSVSQLVESYFASLTAGREETNLDRYEFSDWARRWYGVGVSSEPSVPEDEDRAVLVEQLDRKHR
jgi:hypothetical protein